MQSSQETRRGGPFFRQMMGGRFVFELNETHSKKTKETIKTP